MVAVGAGLAIVFGFLWVARRHARGAHGSRRRREPAPVHELARRPRRRTRRRVHALEVPRGLDARARRADRRHRHRSRSSASRSRPAFVGQGYDEVDLGPLDNFPENGWVVATFNSEKDPRATSRGAPPSSATTASRTACRASRSSRTAASHLGCPVQPNGPSDDPKTIETESGTVTLKPSQPSGFACPCHGGAYDNEGNRTAGPPVRALDRYKFSIVDGHLVLGEPYSVGKVTGRGAGRADRGVLDLRPGPHVDGSEQVFYPYVP